jgi:hypothetical protein
VHDDDDGGGGVYVDNYDVVYYEFNVDVEDCDVVDGDVHDNDWNYVDDIGNGN